MAGRHYAKFTYDDFLLFHDDLRRHELIGGDHYATPSPDIRHQRISGNLLVVEIASPETRKRDETIKRRLYEQFGVSEYWVVDPEIDVIRVYRRDRETFARPWSCRARLATCSPRRCFPGSRSRCRVSLQSSVIVYGAGGSLTHPSC